MRCHWPSTRVDRSVPVLTNKNMRQILMHDSANNQAAPEGQVALTVSVDAKSLEELVRRIVTKTIGLSDWPAGRIALDEGEAAAACGVARHVLRDLRLAGRIQAKKLGRKYVYSRSDLLDALSDTSGACDCNRKE